MPRNCVQHKRSVWSLTATSAIATYTTITIAPVLSQTAGIEPEQQSAPESAATTPGKDQYNLFNPTPDWLLRPFSTDRPGKTHSALTVDAGHFVFEGDLWNYTWDRWSKKNTKTRDYILMNTNLKFVGVRCVHSDLKQSRRQASNWYDRTGDRLWRCFCWR